TPSTTLQIPTDPNINNPAFPSTNFMLPGRTPVGSPTNPPNQFFTMFGGAITGISGYTIYPLTGGGGGTFQTLSISFVPSVSNPVLLWGGHVASQLDWGPGRGAGSTSGNVQLSQVSLAQNGQVVDSASRTLSFMASQVVIPTLIVVVKNA